MSDIFFQTVQAELSLLKQTAEKNFETLKSNPYPGQGVILGISDDGKFVVQLYWLMDKILKNQEIILKSGETQGSVVVCQKNVVNPIWVPMLQKTTILGEYRFVVSNGDHTNAILKGISFERNWNYQLDEPNFTPRIAGITTIYDHKKLRSSLMIITKKENSRAKKFLPWDLDNIVGLGDCIHAYEGDGDPLPSFKGVYYKIPLIGSIKDIANLYWDALNPDYRVSLVVKFINIANPGDVQVLIKNKHNG